MIGRVRNVNGKYHIWICLWFSVVLCLLHPVAVRAEDWTVYVPDDQATGLSYQAVLQSGALETVDDEDDQDDEYFDDEVELINDLATDSDWQLAQSTPSNAALIRTSSDNSIVQNDGIMLLSNYHPYDSSMSTSVIAYYDDVLPKLGNVHYVLFRSGQYDYRMVYGKDLVYNNGNFTAGSVRYVAYSTRYYTWTQGTESAFSLSAGDYLVYSDLGDYPMLHSESIYQWLLILLGAVYLLFIIYRAMFSPRRVTL